MCRQWFLEPVHSQMWSRHHHAGAGRDEVLCFITRALITQAPETPAIASSSQTSLNQRADLAKHQTYQCLDLALSDLHKYEKKIIFLLINHIAAKLNKRQNEIVKVLGGVNGKKTQKQTSPAFAQKFEITHLLIKVKVNLHHTSSYGPPGCEVSVSPL